VLYARIGEPRCPVGGEPIRKMTIDEMVDVVLQRTVALHADPATIKAKKNKNSTNEIVILAPIVRGRKGEYFQLMQDLYQGGFLEVRLDGQWTSLRKPVKNLARYQQHTIELVVDRVPLAWPIEGNTGIRARLAEALAVAVDRGNDTAIAVLDDLSEHIMSSKFSCPTHDVAFPDLEPRLFSFNSPYGACSACNGLGTKEIFSEEPCDTCHGARLRTESLHVFVGGKSIVETTALTIDKAWLHLADLNLNPTQATIAEPIMKEILARLQFLLDVGLQYLTLNRMAGSLSGGEAQRIRLASQIGSRLVGALYVLDEPTIGLHQRDNARLIQTLEKLRDAGNTVIVVEHDEDTIAASDYLVAWLQTTSVSLTNCGGRRKKPSYFRRALTMLSS
jgi:excinuclease ABC subunit A